MDSNAEPGPNIEMEQYHERSIWLKEHAPPGLGSDKFQNQNQVKIQRHAGRGRKRNKEEGGTRRKEGRGGRSEEEEGAPRIVKN